MFWALVRNDNAKQGELAERTRRRRQQLHFEGDVWSRVPPDEKVQAEHRHSFGAEVGLVRRRRLGVSDRGQRDVFKG